MLDEIARLANVISLLRQQLNKDLPSQHIALLLAVARQPGITMPDLSRTLGMPQGTVSRNVKLMSHYCENNGSKVGRKGYGLLKSEQAADNRYQLAVSLTAEGEKLMQELVSLLAHNKPFADLPDESSNSTYAAAR